MEVGFRRPRHKRHRRNDIQNDRLRIYQDLKQKCLKGVLMDSAVWICVSDDVVKQFDSACLGNLDGGHGMAAFIREIMSMIDVELPDTCRNTVRLSLDEAFFLHYALKALDLCNVDTTSKQPTGILETKQIWEHMIQGRSDFPILYICYHHFRSKGWIARTGLQYGVDFVLYQKHPALAHSDYSVVIQTPGISDGRPPMSWHDLQITNRLTGQVGKRLLIVNIHDPAQHVGFSDPTCIDRVSLSEYLVRRWVPEKTQ